MKILGTQDSTGPPASRTPLDWAALQCLEPPPREWVLPHWIPASHITLLAGRGGIGKTLIAQHLATAVALGKNYIEPAKLQHVLMWAGEDDHAELWRRQRNICSWMGEPLNALAGRFTLHSYAGVDITLATITYGQLAPTAMLEELRKQVQDYQAKFVILDNIARLFGGSENDRHQVTTFVALVQGACQPATVLLLGHPAKAQGSEFSGSTAWEGAVRARLYLSDRPPDANAGDHESPPDDRVRYLARRKANYSPLELRRLTLEDGVLIPESVDPERARAPSGEFAADIVRRAVRRLKDMGFYGNTSTRSPDYLPKLANSYGLLDALPEKRFGTTMRTLIVSGELVTVVVGQYSNRSPKMGLVLK